MIPSYYKNYVMLLDSKNVLESLKKELLNSIQFYNKISEEKSTFKYQPDKWSIREVLGHTCDTEQIFSYRALSALRGETQPLPGYDQDIYVSLANFDRYSLGAVIKRFELLRTNTILMFEQMSKDELTHTCFANGLEFTTEALGLIIAGHDLHHRRIIEERYLT
jgi:hypothetical protein